MNTVVIFDLEWNSWKGNYKLNNNLVEIRQKWQFRNIIQIGAIKFNYKKYEIIDEINIYVKTENIFLHNYIVNLTKIDIFTIKTKGYFFFKANKIFNRFIEDANIVLCNGNDFNVYKENLKKHRLEDIFVKKKKINIRNYLKKKFFLNEEKVSSPNLLSLKFFKSHDALNDAKKIFFYIKSKNIKISDIKKII